MALYNETYAIHGMQQDNSPKLPSNEYSFENFNIRFSTEGPNSKIVIKPEMGNSQVRLRFFDNLDYIYEGTNKPPTIDSFPFVIIGACVVDRYIVIFGKEDSQRGRDYIVRLEKAYEANGIVYFNCVYLFDGSIDLNFKFTNNIETHPYVETELQKKVYFCDGENFIRCINVVNPQCINNLGLLNIGRHLALNERLTVTKKPGVFGSLPGGKLQIAFSYGTDLESMTSIIDYSALYDCVFENAGIAPDADPEHSFADHTFEVRIDNLDPSFEWIFIYIIHRTTLDATPVIYVKNIHIESDSVVYTINLGDSDIYQSNKTIAELLDFNSIIPLTMQPYENRMFAGNIKIINDMLPHFSEEDIRGSFYLKTVGHEYLRNHTYNYNPSDNVFAGSSYDNKGFRKGNWYKFGIIGQYEHGDWTDVMSLTTRQCDTHSLTELDLANPSEVIIKNVKFGVGFTAHAIDKLLYLKSIGVKKIKPVCVYPTDSEKTIISQGVINPTVYRGKNRRTLNGNSPFAQPSWFFRPIKFFEDFYGDHSPYTMRNINDLRYSKNFLEFKENYSGPDGDGSQNSMEWFRQLYLHNDVTALFSNPEYTNKLSPYCNWNENFREFRHGMSLPTKDRINAECEFSEISGLDYAYSDEIERNFLKIGDYCISKTSALGKDSGEVFLDNEAFNINNYNYWQRDGDGLLTTARPSIICNGYDNMVFVDSSICTFNSPEIDYYLIGGLGSSNINISSPEYTMHLCGKAEINGSLSGIRIAPTNTIDNAQNSSDVEYWAGAETVQGTCITETRLFNVPGVKELLFRRNSIGNTKSPFCYTAGPFWFDKLLVLGFTGKEGESRINDTPYSDPVTYTVYPENNATSGHMVGAFSANLFAGRHAVGFLLGFDPISFDTTLALLLCFSINWASHRRVKRSTFQSISQMVQTYYGELCHRYDADEDNVKKDTLITSGKIFFGKYSNLSANRDDLKNICPLIYTEASDLGNNYNAFGDLYNADFSQLLGGDYTSGKALAERITAFANLGISLETFVDNSYFNLNYLNVFTNSANVNGEYWKNFFALSDPIENHWNSGSRKFDDTYADDLSTKNISGGGNLCYFYGWWSRPRSTETDPSFNNSQYWNDPIGGRADFWNYVSPADLINAREVKQRHLVTMTYPYTLPSSVTVHPLNRKYRGLTPSVYGSHYYGQFSTDFPNALFDPYYAHVVYPIMHTNANIPFCGTSTPYETAADSRPIYNYTSSVLYSNTTSYFKGDISFDTENHFINEDFEYITIPYLGDNYSLQKYGTDKNDLIKYDTVSLTAATKWYRGWRNVLSDGNEGELSMVSKGWNEENYEFSIFGNLVFSGYLPQLFTKSGHVTFGNNERDFMDNEKYYTAVSGFRKGISGLPQVCQFDYISSPHIVFCDNSVKTIKTILPSRAITTGNKYSFDFYYKDFVTNSTIRDSFIRRSSFHINYYQQDLSNCDTLFYTSQYSTQALAQYDIGNTFRIRYLRWYFPGLSWSCANYIYPHTGNWVPITKEKLPDPQIGHTIFEDNITDYPYWMRKNSTSDLNQIRTSYYSISGLKDSYHLFLADYVNKAYENTSPYTENVEFYSWRPCGESVLIDDIINALRPSGNATVSQSQEKPVATTLPVLHYLEGDTYTTRYNCLKTVLPGDPVDLQVKNGISECASLYIETYINLDGRYNNHEALYNDADFSYIMNGTVEQVSKINPVYSQPNNIFSYFEKNENYESTRIEHFPTLIQWSPIKVTGSRFDSFGTFPSSNAFYADGTQGMISKLITAPSNRVLCFQEHGISLLDINPQALLSTEASVIEINASSSSVLTRSAYLDRTYGCQDKWTVTNAVDGVYFMDNQKKIIGKVGGDQVNHVSALLGFESWSKDNLSLANSVWEAGSYVSSIPMSDNSKERTGFVSYYDPYYSDLYFINKDVCLSLNLPLGCFTSFYSYNNVPYIVNSSDGSYSFIVSNATNKSTWMFRQYYTQDHTFYFKKKGYYIDILANPYPLYDKVYNFISYDNECYDTNGTFLRANGYNKLTVTNYRQTGVLSFNRTNTRIKFRTWRTEFPREVGSKMNRIRGTWCRVKFEHTDSGLIDGTNNLHNFSINYSILEQPLVASADENDK